jgi:hypothetical protein
MVIAVGDWEWAWVSDFGLHFPMHTYVCTCMYVCTYACMHVWVLVH